MDLRKGKDWEGEKGRGRERNVRYREFGEWEGRERQRIKEWR